MLELDQRILSMPTRQASMLTRRQLNRWWTKHPSRHRNIIRQMAGSLLMSLPNEGSLKGSRHIELRMEVVGGVMEVLMKVMEVLM